MEEVGGCNLLRHIVHISAHRAAARPCPVTAPRAEDDDPGVDDLAVEQVLLRPRGDVFSRIEVPRASLVLHDLLQSHGGPRPTPEGGKTFVDLAAVSECEKTEERSSGDEEDCEEAKAEGDIGRDVEACI